MAERSRVTHVLLALVLLALLAVVAMLANDARGGPLDPTNAPGSTDGVRGPGTPISGSTTINAPGYYYLTRNLSNATIVISASDVTLDLGGFTLTKTPPATGPGGITLSPGVLGVVVTNGGVVGYEVGIVASQSQVRISDVHLRSNGTGAMLGGSSVIERCVVLDNTEGNRIFGSLTSVRDCDITLNDVAGIIANPRTSGTLIERSSIKNNNLLLNILGGGIYMAGNRGTIRDNDFDFNGGAADIRFSVVVNEGQHNSVIDNVFGCPTNFQPPVAALENYIPMNTTDPHTNHTHFTPC